MSADTAPDFDLGPLSWVQGEIDQALNRGLEALATFKANPADPTALKHARTHVHQAAGAIQMVGLDAAVAFTDEVERQLAGLEELPPVEAAAACDLLDRGCRKLAIFLAELTTGAPPIPLKLYPEYEAMQRRRGLKATTPTDLFYPDLSPRAPKIAPREVLPPNKLPSYLIKQRRLYQRGLLVWLRGDDEGAKGMRDAITGIEDITTQSGLRSFWWTVGALLDGVVEKGIETSFGVKQLTARIDLQIRRVAEGSAKAADRLRREVLYFVAISAPVSPQVQAVQRAFKLSGLIPTAEVLNADLVRIQPLVREAREQLAAAKDAWLKFASGRAENLPKLKATLASVHTKAAEVKHGALMKLTSALVERLDKMPSQGVSESVAMEYATALLLAESAFENYTGLGADFPKQVDGMLARFDAARAGRAPVAGGAPVLDEMSKRAQERVLLAQVGREIQANLRHVEQVLDAFFRDNSRRAELATLAKDTQQVRGALRILGLAEAERLLALCEEQIDQYANSAEPVSNDELEMLAESLSGLGFYVEAVEQQRPDRERLIAPLIEKRSGREHAPAVEPGDSVEAAVGELRAALPALVEEVRRAPSDAAAREGLKRKLADLRDDAELIGDTELAAQAESALEEFETGGAAALAAAVGAIADTAAPAPEISDETRRLLETASSELDSELLEIYLVEAGEVLDTVAEQRATLERNPGDREALTTVRRGFHTLKGSGRMVGLKDLGELAFEVEKVHNRVLEEERPVTPEMLTLIGVAEKCFRGWVAALQNEGRVVADPRKLHAAIAAVTAKWPAGAAPVDAAATKPAVVIPIPVAPSAESPPAAGTDTFELPELGAASMAGAPVVHTDEGAGETIDLEPLPMLEPLHHGAPTLKLVADNTRLHVQETPIAAHAAPAAVSGFSIEPLPEPEPDEVTIGGVTLSTSLFRILSEEAEQHLATLARELQLLQFDPNQAPSQAMIRASHTLCGIHRTGGFPVVAETAKALELALTTLEHRGALPSRAQPILARAVACLEVLAGHIRARESFAAQDEREAQDVRAELDELRQDAETGPALLDAEAAAEAAAMREDEPAAAPSASEPVLPSLSPPAPPAPEPAPSPQVPVEVPPADLATAIAALAHTEGDPLAGVQDEVADEQVLSIFLDEAAELFPQAGEHVRNWRRDPSVTDTPSELRRILHTFKGSARMAGAMRLGELTHRMESRLMDGESLTRPTPELFEALETDLDHLGYVLDKLRSGEINVELPQVAPSPAAAPAPRATGALAEAPTPGTPRVVPPLPAVPVRAAAPAKPVTAAPVPPAPGTARAAETRGAPRSEAFDLEGGARAMLRVRADTIDRLVNEAGEVAIARARVEGELRSLKTNLLELTNSVIRLRSQVREIELQAETQIQSRMSAIETTHEEFDPLELDRYTRFQELTRSLAEGVNDVSTVQQSLLKNLDDADAALLAQARLSRDVQQKLFAIRTVPFGSLSDRLYRILRTTAKELDKRANLEIRGAQTELDRSVLEKLVGPLEHLLRNALDHGLEPRAARVAAGKLETGEITLTVRQVGNEVAIELADDGSGIDLARVAERARSLGLIAPDAKPTDAQLVECIFQPGFSTASRVTQISGRGIGMDVVRAEIAGLGGRVDVASAPGKGTTFTLSLPLTLAVAQAVLIRAGGRLWALPAPMVEQVQQVKAEALLNLYVQRKVEWQGKTYPFHYLPRLLGDMAHNPETLRYNPVILLRAGQFRTGIHVDEIIGNQEIVVKNIGPQLARVSGISGATVLGTGEIVLIINPVQLAQRADIPIFDPNAEERVVTERQRAAMTASSPPLVMIVDDSLTVRKFTSRLLQRAGFEVVTAKDGVDALQLLGDQTPDVILLDIEMPRMDGFEFAKTIKGDRRNAHVPIIMITSRTAEKHRHRAQELGVDLYLGKPYQEEELLRHLREMLELAAPA